MQQGSDVYFSTSLCSCDFTSPILSRYIHTVVQKYKVNERFLTYAIHFFLPENLCIMQSIALRWLISISNLAISSTLASISPRKGNLLFMR